MTEPVPNVSSSGCATTTSARGVLTSSFLARGLDCPLCPRLPFVLERFATEVLPALSPR